MRVVVIDASVAVKWVVEEEHSTAAASLFHCEARHAPDHWQAEAVNALWAKVLQGDLSAGDATARMQLLVRAPVIGTALSGLMPRAFAISLVWSVTVYDALYVALAERLKAPLVTDDRSLLRRMAQGAVATANLMWIGDIASAG